MPRLATPPELKESGSRENLFWSSVKWIWRRERMCLLQQCVTFLRTSDTCSLFISISRLLGVWFTGNKWPWNFLMFREWLEGNHFATWKDAIIPSNSFADLQLEFLCGPHVFCIEQGLRRGFTFCGFPPHLKFLFWWVQNRIKSCKNEDFARRMRGAWFPKMVRNQGLLYSEPICEDDQQLSCACGEKQWRNQWQRCLDVQKALALRHRGKLPALNAGDGAAASDAEGTLHLRCSFRSCRHADLQGQGANPLTTRHTPRDRESSLSQINDRKVSSNYTFAWHKMQLNDWRREKRCKKCILYSQRRVITAPCCRRVPRKK